MQSQECSHWTIPALWYSMGFFRTHIIINNMCSIHYFFFHHEISSEIFIGWSWQLSCKVVCSTILAEMEMSLRSPKTTCLGNTLTISNAFKSRIFQIFFCSSAIRKAHSKKINPRVLAGKPSVNWTIASLTSSILPLHLTVVQIIYK